MAIDYGKTEILTRNRKKLEVATESDLDKEGSTIFAIRVTDYYRVREYREVMALINDLNRRYSESPELDFYRDYYIPKKKKT